MAYRTRPEGRTSLGQSGRVTGSTTIQQTDNISLLILAPAVQQ